MCFRIDSARRFHAGQTELKMNCDIAPEDIEHFEGYSNPAYRYLYVKLADWSGESTRHLDNLHVHAWHERVLPWRVSFYKSVPLMV